MMSRLDLEDANGIRIYFGQYSEQIFVDHPDETNGLPVDLYKEKCTVILVATEGREGVPGSDLLKGGFITDLDPEDRGMLCPPNTGCDCSSPLIDKPDIWCP